MRLAGHERGKGAMRTEIDSGWPGIEFDCVKAWHGAAVLGTARRGQARQGMSEARAQCAHFFNQE